jgi:hypothetical protein
MAITTQDRYEWAHSSVTQEFLEELRRSQQETMEAWAGEGFVANTFEVSAVQNATALGGMRVLKELISLIEAYSDEGEEL